MLLPIGIWLLSVVFGSFLGHGLLMQLSEKRARKRWYVHEKEDARDYIPRATQPVDYWLSMGMQTCLFMGCVYAAMTSL